MINPQNQRTEKILELLEQMNLFTGDEITLMEDYLNGAVEDQALETLTFHDLTTVPNEVTTKMRGIGQELVNRGRNGEALKLGRLLFAVGASTCHEMMPMISYYSFDPAMLLVEEPEKKAAVYGAKIAMNEYQISRYCIKNLEKIAGNDPDVIKKAVSYQKNKYDNGKLMLLMVYFQMRYANTMLKEKDAPAKTGGLLAGVGKLLGKGAAEDAVTEISAEDAALLKEYGDILVNSLGNLYRGQMPRLQVDEIANAVNRDKVDGRILKMASPNLSVDRFMLRLLGGTAFVNYAQDQRLKNVVKICLAAGGETMLDAMENVDVRGELNRNGGKFDEIFSFDCRKLIKWAAAKGKTEILRGQFAANRAVYLEYMDRADFDIYNRMNGVLREKDPALFEERKGKEIYRMQAKVVQAFAEVVDSGQAGTVRAYLNGEAGLDTLYACEDKLQTGGNRWSAKHLNILQSYQNGYGHDALSNRCEAFWMVYRGNNYNYLKSSSKMQAATVKRLFRSVDSEGLDLRHQLYGYSDIYDSFYSEEAKAEFQAAARMVFLGYLETRREDMLAAFQASSSNARCLGVQVLAEHPEENKAELLGYAQDSSKGVREELLNVLCGRMNWEEELLKLLASKKAAEREIAIRVLAKWGDRDYTGPLTEALAKEKNGKVKTLLETVLHVTAEDGSGGGDRAVTREDLVKELHKGGKKRSLAWAYETPFSTVHKRDGEEASEEYLQAVFLCYAGMSPCGVNPGAATLAEGLDEREFAVYVNELFDKWMEAGAESKKRWVLYAASIHGGDEIVRKLNHQIQEWPAAARGAIASEAVQALALNPRPQALLIVDGISRKFKFKQVKAAAGKALEFAASQLGITTEELADRIVPDLGFNENMERTFDYGERQFTVAITTALEIEVFDEKGKKLKSLPSPGKRDDENKAPAAYEEFKQMKKQMKATVSSQKMRLEMALSTGRQWSVESWKRLFVRNPIMHQFATGLVWGVYEDRKLSATFRYMEDGSFNTEDEDEFELPEGAGAPAADAAAHGEKAAEAGQTRKPDITAGAGGPMIGLVHPIELTEESLKAWKEQLEDYEITQPVEQLERPVYYRTKEEEDQTALERFGGCIVNDLSLGGKLQSMGWYRGSVQDAGGFYTYYREDKELGLGVELHFSGSYVGGENEDVTVYEARFYNAGGTIPSENSGVMKSAIKRGSYVYDEANDTNSYYLKEVPERYFSEIVLQLARATAASKEKNVNWKTRR